MIRQEAEWAVLGSHQGSVGILSWHSDQVSAYRFLKTVREEGGQGKVVPVIDGELTEEHNLEKAEMFKRLYEKTING